MSEEQYHVILRHPDGALSILLCNKATLLSVLNRRHKDGVKDRFVKAPGLQANECIIIIKAGKIVVPKSKETTASLTVFDI
jgi:hypothetical protein